MNRYIASAAVATIGVSGAEIVVPEQVMRLLGAPAEEVTPTTRTMVRAFGARNFLLGAMLLTPRGRTGLKGVLPVFVAAEVAAVGLALLDGETSPTLPLLGGSATLSLVALVWKGLSEG